MLITLRDAFARAFSAESRGEHSLARAIYDDILAAVPEHPGALLGIARQMRARSDWLGARAVIGRALVSAKTQGMPTADLLLELGTIESVARNQAAARVAYDAALVEAPRSLPALLCAGSAALVARDFVAADLHFRAMLAIEVGRVSAWIGLAQALAGAGRFAEARSALERALALGPPDAAVTAAAAWVALQQRDWITAKRWCEAGLLATPHNAVLLRLLGEALKLAVDPSGALRAFEASIAADPDDVSARVGLGAALLDVGRADEARAHLSFALDRGANSAELYDNLGLSLLVRDDHEAAATMFQRAIAVNPSMTSAICGLVTSRQYLCQWSDLDQLERILMAAVEDRVAQPYLSPFVPLSLNFSPQQQLAVARRWSQATLPTPQTPTIARLRHQRLRVGYLSNDFNDHATARLIVGLIEAHNRRRVETFGYSYGVRQVSNLRARMERAFEHWRDLKFEADAEIARSIRADGIDVLIDLKGHTRGARLGALATRPATVQLHYMGFPGTLGYDGVDGIIADGTVVPPGDELHYHEPVFRLPRCYLATDNARVLPERAPRARYGLPDDALVLGSLNQSYKYNPALFAIWMDALRAVPNAVLWLFASHARTQVNLRAEAVKHGIAEHRLVFATRTAQPEHIARVRCMDLALDTLPYGSHTTGVDALWAGVPMLTCRGRTFAGRVGASLLSAVELTDLITSDLDEYRRRLIDLATTPDSLRDCARHLERGRNAHSLWDTRSFAADFEQLLERAYVAITSARC